MDINARLDLDNYIKDIASKFPKNDDDYFFFIRGKDSSGEMFLISVAEQDKLGYSLYNLGIQNEIIKQEVLMAAEAIQMHEKQNNETNTTK